MSKHSSSPEADLIVIISAGIMIYYYREIITKIIYFAVIPFAIFELIFLIIKFKKLFRYMGFRYPSNLSVNDINSMSGIEFELYVAKQLKSLGYTDIVLTEKYDYGVDIIATKESIVWGVQVKRYSGMVGADAVRQVVTGLKKYNCDKAMVITNSYFSNFAIELAKVNNCKLVDRFLIN